MFFQSQDTASSKDPDIIHINAFFTYKEALVLLYTKPQQNRDNLVHCFLNTIFCYCNIPFKTFMVSDLKY